MNYTEHAITFPVALDSVTGIVTGPARPVRTGVLVAVGGPQYRAGSHRQFVLLSRFLAEAGYPSLRFDYRGMGDSTGEQRSFEAVDDDLSAAIDAFMAQCPGVERVVIWGLCDAATAALLHVGRQPDPRIGGLVLLNPWARSEATLARTHVKHYYGQRLLQADFWRKLLSGQVGVGRALKGFLGNWRRARQPSSRLNEGPALPFQQRMMNALADFRGPVLLILSGEDYTAREFLEASRTLPGAARALAGPRVTRVDVAAADHTFSCREWRGAVESATLAWLNEALTA